MLPHAETHCPSESPRMAAGVCVYDTGRVAHAQYIATTAEGRELNLLTPLFHKLITETFRDRAYFDFGTSNGEWRPFPERGTPCDRNSPTEPPQCFTATTVCSYNEQQKSELSVLPGLSALFSEYGMEFTLYLVVSAWRQWSFCTFQDTGRYNGWYDRRTAIDTVQREVEISGVVAGCLDSIGCIG